MNLRSWDRLLRAEILQVAGCTEPASVAYAFLTARNHLNARMDIRTARATLYGSADVLRNASTATLPFLNLRGLRAVVAAGLAARTNQFNLFPAVDQDEAHSLLQRRGWLSAKPVRRHGVYVKAVITTPTKSVEVIIQGRHNQITRISRNGRTICQPPPWADKPLSMAGIMAAAQARDAGLEAQAREFIIRQVRGQSSQPLPRRVAELVQDRMCGSVAPVMTITGSGNQGIFIGVPFYAAYRDQGSDVLPAVVLALLTQVYLSQKRSRISGDCGLATKSAPALAAGLAFAQGAGRAEIQRAMQSVTRALGCMACHGAQASCGRKAERAMRTVLDLVPGNRPKKETK